MSYVSNWSERLLRVIFSHSFFNRFSYFCLFLWTGGLKCGEAAGLLALVFMGRHAGAWVAKLADCLRSLVGSLVAEIAEEADHHPDIDIRFTRVLFSLSTHSEGGITEKDFSLAKKIDELYEKEN